MKTKHLTLTALTAALCCVISPIAIPVGAVPVSLSLFAVCLAAAVPGALRGTAAVAIYVALGALGLPVFAGFAGGIGHIAGATGGFIVGYIPCALVVSLLTAKSGASSWKYPLGMALGTLLCYLCGALWYAAVTHITLLQALSVSVLPFVLFDVLKIAAASLLAIRLRAVLSGAAKR
ncbi:MAG: biotin transporter BioY [Ruminococcaceae bacterium]|nr:biotin transporter BioY [Oscillospiraceae bacterium]